MLLVKVCQVITRLERDGWNLVRTKGSHRFPNHLPSASTSMLDLSLAAEFLHRGAKDAS